MMAYDESPNPTPPAHLLPTAAGAGASWAIEKLGTAEKRQVLQLTVSPAVSRGEQVAAPSMSLSARQFGTREPTLIRKPVREGLAFQTFLPRRKGSIPQSKVELHLPDSSNALCTASYLSRNRLLKRRSYRAPRAREHSSTCHQESSRLPKRQRRSARALPMQSRKAWTGEGCRLLACAKLRVDVAAKLHSHRTQQTHLRRPAARSKLREGRFHVVPADLRCNGITTMPRPSDAD